MLKATDLTVFARVSSRWNKNQRGTPILKNINLSLAPGRITVFMGPNGAGKSTLLKTLGGLIYPDEGRVELFDQGQSYEISPKKSHSQELRQLIGQKLSWYGDQSPIPFGFSVYDVVMMGRFPHHRGWPTPQDSAVVEENIDLFGLASLTNRSVLTLSSGELQKTMLARVFANQPHAVLLDEPTSHLDPSAVLYVERLIKKKAQAGSSIAVVLHDLSLAFRWADHMVVMDHGQITAEGAPHDPLIGQAIKDVFQLSLGFLKSPEGDTVVYFKEQPQDIRR